MRYRTVLEVICNAANKDEACDIAGEYLKGNIDFGVEMKCHTESLAGHKATRYVASSVLVLLVLASFTFRVTPVSVEEGAETRTRYQIGIHDTHTVMPALKTRHREDFKQEWQDRKDEAILEYLKQ